MKHTLMKFSPAITLDIALAWSPNVIPLPMMIVVQGIEVIM